MMMTDVLTLVKMTHSTDAYGDDIVTETERQVFCTPVSVGQREFYEAQAVGLSPELKFILTDALDYQDELYLIHRSTRYRVLRTYRKGKQLELTCTREVNP